MNTHNLSKFVLISVYDKTGVVALAKAFLDRGYRIISTGGTYSRLERFNKTHTENSVVKVSDLTGFPEILGGRVKTLHPKIFGGILSQLNEPSHLETLENT